MSSSSVQSPLQASLVEQINKAGPGSVRTLYCGGRPTSLSPPQGDRPLEAGLFLETCDTSVSDGVFLKLLLTSSDSFLRAGFYLCL